MKISDREAQIVRIQSTSFQPELSPALEAKLRQVVVGVTKATLEAALVEELSAARARQSELLGRCSGYFTRVLDTDMGIEHRWVPNIGGYQTSVGTEAKAWQQRAVVASPRTLSSGPGQSDELHLESVRHGTLVERLTRSAVSSMSKPISHLATDYQVSRKFVCEQSDQAKLALDEAFEPTPPDEQVFFPLRLTKAWLFQLILGLASVLP